MTFTTFTRTGLAAVGTLAIGLGAAMGQSTQISTQDQTFVNKVSKGNQAEIEMAKLAEEKASNQDVKNFAQKMITDHTKINDQMKGVASQIHADVPSSLSAGAEASKTKLETLSGSAFDKAYIKTMLSDHQTDIKLYQGEAEDSSNSDLKSFASDTLPTLEDHIRLADHIAGQIGVSGKKALNNK